MPDVFIDKNGDGVNDLTTPTTPSGDATVLHNNTQHPMGLLSSYSFHPSDVHFESQEDQEEIHLFMRQHFLINLPWIILSLLLIILPFFAVPVFDLINLPAVLTPILQTSLSVFYYVAVFGYALANFVNWYFNIYLVTNTRVIDVDFYNLLNRQISTARIEDIRDVTSHTTGLFGSYFDFGDVLMQTEATIENIEFENVPHPDQVRVEVEKLIDERRKLGGG